MSLSGLKKLVGMQGVGHGQHHYPRNGSWTGVSVRFCGFLARPHLATATRQPPRCKEEQHRQGVAKTYHRTRSALTQKVNNLNPQNINEYAVFQTMSSGQLPFLGLLTTDVFDRFLDFGNRLFDFIVRDVVFEALGLLYGFGRRGKALNRLGHGHG